MCYWTVCHTPPYEIADAEALITRIFCQTLRQPIPQQALDQPLRFRAIRPSVPLGKIDCANSSCMTSIGTRTKGCKTCIDLMCVHCCSSTAENAHRTSTPRDQCKTHKQLAVRGGYLPEPGPSFPAPPPQPAFVPQAAPSIVIQPLDSTRTANTGPIDALVPQPNTVALPPTMHASVHTSQPNASSQPSRPLGRSKPLAQPLPDVWRQAWDGASKARDVVKSLKVQRQEMEDRAKRMVDVVMYFAVSY